MKLWNILLYLTFVNDFFFVFCFFLRAKLSDQTCRRTWNYCHAQKEKYVHFDWQINRLRMCHLPLSVIVPRFVLHVRIFKKYARWYLVLFHRKNKLHHCQRQGVLIHLSLKFFVPIWSWTFKFYFPIFGVFFLKLVFQLMSEFSLLSYFSQYFGLLASCISTSQ